MLLNEKKIKYISDYCEEKQGLLIFLNKLFKQGR